MTDDLPDAAPPPGPSPVEAAIFALLAAGKPGASVSPEQVARAVNEAGWRRELGKVRHTVVGLARAGRIEVTRHGKRADPDAFKGVYRLRLPTESSAQPPAAEPEPGEQQP